VRENRKHGLMREGRVTPALYSTKDYDFTDAKTVAETPHLAKLQAEAGGKLHILQRTPDKV
jgi:hypothetical protein